MRGEERPTSPGEEIGRARAEEFGDRYNRQGHPNEGVTKLEQRGDKGSQRGETTRPKGRTLERSGNQTSRRPDTPTRRRIIKETVKGKHGPLRH
jgi:hypothetical protein